MALLRPTLGVLLHFVVIAVATAAASRRCQTLNQLPQAALHLMIFLQ